MASFPVRALLGFQGGFYLLTGVWPLISIRSFKAATGEKTDNWTGLDADHWLVYTVSCLILGVAIPLLIAAWCGEFGWSIASLAMVPAIGLTTIDIVSVVRGVILPVYLLDAIAEITLLCLWTLVLLRLRYSGPAS